MALEDITVVILSRGRDEILRRSLEYWASLPMKILVLHHTDSPLTTFTQNKNVNYIQSNTPYGNRCALAAQFISSKFAILVSDDDFYLSSGLLALSDFLEARKDLVSVGGQTISVGRYGKLITGTSAYPHAREYKNLENSISGRLEKHFNIEIGYINGSMYRLFRTNYFIDLMNKLGSLTSIRTPYIFEVSSEIFANAAGKSEYLNCVLWIRNWINPPVNHSEWKRNVYFFQWATDPEYSDEFYAWKEFIRKHLDFELETFDNLLRRIIEVRQLSEKNEISSLKKRRLPIPPDFKYFIRRFIRPDSVPNSVYMEVQKMIDAGVMVNSKEVEKALKFL